MGLRRRVDSGKTAAPKAEGSSKSREQWQQWGNTLRKYQLHDLAAWVLEAAGPLALISAQLLYMGMPLLGPRAGRLAHLLESDEDTRDFLRILEADATDQDRVTSGTRA
jgi:hypothetical protein